MTKIDEILGSCTRDELLAMTDYLGAPLRESAPKKVIVSELSSYLSNSPVVWLGMLPENDLRLLKRLVDAGPDKHVLILRPDYPSVVEAVKIVCNDRDEDYDTVEVWLPEAMHQIVAPHIRRVISAKEKDGSFALERIVMGYMNAYGVIPLHTFVNLLFDHLGDSDEMLKLGSRVLSCPLMRLYQEMYRGEAYMVSPFVDNVKEIMDYRKNSFKTLRKYADGPEWTRAERAGDDAPFCAWGMDTPEGKALKEMLVDLGFSGDELQEAIHTVWIDSQFAVDDEATEVLFSVVTDRQEELGSFELFKQCIDVVVDYANSIPKWLLKGHTSNETGMMKITVRVDELIKEYNYDEPGLNLYKLGFAVRPVAPDAPCPCGSGLSYRFCHGKVLN